MTVDELMKAAMLDLPLPEESWPDALAEVKPKSSNAIGEPTASTRSA
ncbi:MAG: hypothetical protein M3O46_04015 [Myxococcota bacterium]|nr:hypothetical protein [Myxococcota bacterium]